MKNLYFQDFNTAFYSPDSVGDCSLCVSFACLFVCLSVSQPERIGPLLTDSLGQILDWTSQIPVKVSFFSENNLGD